MEPMNKVRVLLADDHSLFREGMANILNGQPDFEVVGEASNGLDAVEKALELRPDLILMDIGMPVFDGLEATRQIKQEMRNVVIVMLTMRDEDEKLFAALKNGAQGYLLKSIRSWDMVDLLRGAMKGNAAITQALAGRMLEEFRRLSQVAPSVPKGVDIALTRREQDVLSLVADGATDKQIAESLTLSIHTVKSHMRNILAKLHLSHRHEAALYAVREGLISPPGERDIR
jgi:DNA-binding NarL/FixJ family response regulator